jgi:hypothetical protein
VKSDIPNYITVQTREQLDALFDLEKLVLPPFPKDTYFPPLDKIIVDYQSEANMNPASEFSNINPIGKITDLSKSPLRFVNYILLQKGEGRQYDTYIVTEQVYNPADGTFSLLHSGFDAFEPVTSTSTGRGLGTLWSFTDSPKILLPVYQGSVAVLDPTLPCYTYCNQLAYYKEHNLIDANAQMPEIKQWIDLWLTTGKLPKDIEHIVLISAQFYIGQKP